MAKLPQSLYSAAQTRELDRLAIEDCGIPSATLMARAGEAAFACIQRHWPQARHITVLCGSGNNGGDGYVVARAAHEAGLDCRVIALADARSADAVQMRGVLEDGGVKVEAFCGRALTPTDVVVDALLGTGLERRVEQQWAQAIDSINAQPGPVISLDIPSGIHADTGRVMGTAVRADVAITFIGLKFGLFTGRGPEFCRQVEFEDLAVPTKVYANVPRLGARLTAEQLRPLVPQRARDAHKGKAGRVLIVGGDLGMPGAVHMTGVAAYRAGAGLVTIATRAVHAQTIPAGALELMIAAVESREALLEQAAAASVVAVGPGLGRGSWGQGMLAAGTELKVPLIMDADALNLLAEDPYQRENWVLTPHPGEAGRLLGTDAAEVQADRRGAACAIAARYGGICVLKGAGTLIAYDNVCLCDRGNPGMASGGMGDVLTGVIAALVGQGLELSAAARLGVWIHAGAADRAASEGGELGLMATDLLPWIRVGLNALAQGDDTD